MAEPWNADQARLLRWIALVGLVMQEGHEGPALDGLLSSGFVRIIGDRVAPTDAGLARAAELGRTSVGKQRR